jgi:steroid delta-isomerase-like uncharacterized protein
MHLDDDQARLRRVQEHIACENHHDLPGIMQTFGPTAEYNDLPWSDRRTDRDGVQAYYAQLLESVPDLQIDVQRQHVAGDAIVVEVIIRGTHLGAWRGLPATGRPVAIPLCGIYTFDAQNRIAAESIYYDRATVLRQLGVFHEPQTLFGSVMTALTHPVTVARALARKIASRNGR